MKKIPEAIYAAIPQMNPCEQNEPTIAGTPFTMMKHDNKYFLAYGKYRITEDMNTEEESLNELEKNKWNIIARMIGVITEYQLKERKGFIGLP